MSYMLDKQEVTYTLETIKTQPMIENDDALMSALQENDKWEKDICFTCNIC